MISRESSTVPCTVLPIDEPEAPRRSPSPSRRPVSCIVHIRHLVRPYTVGQLKELLSRTGKIVEDGFWIDKIKSHCLVIVSLDLKIIVIFLYPAQCKVQHLPTPAPELQPEPVLWPVIIIQLH